MKHNALATMTLLCVACFGSDTDLETAFCESLEQPAESSVTATDAPEDAPDVTHVSRVDIEFAGSGMESGFVSYLPDEVGSFAFGLTEEVSVMIRDADGVAVDIERTVVGSTLCDALAVRFTAALTIQRYTLELGAGTTGTLGIVAEESDDDL